MPVEDSYTKKDTENVKDINKAVFVVKKTEKLTSALYKVTELVPDEEPLKWQLRGTSLDLLIETLSLMNAGNVAKKSVFNNVISNINKITSLLEVSFMGSIVSQMNFSILKDEYSSIRDILLGIEKDKHLPLQLSVPHEELEKARDNHAKTATNNEILKDIYKGHKETISPLEYKDKGQAKPDLTRTIKKNSIPVRRSTEGREKRRQMILDIIKVNGEVSIKDIFIIPLVSQNYSEKTIQRELIGMVSEGLIKKKGERRWSKYHL